MELQDVLAFIRDRATLEDLSILRDAHVQRVRSLQRSQAQTFQSDERVLFVHDGIEEPALVLHVNRRTVSICLGNHRHIRCDASFLRKVPAESLYADSALAAG